MERKLGRKLELSRETVRELTNSELSQVAGGGTIALFTCNGCGGGSISAPSTCICLATQSHLTCGTCC